MGSSGVWHRFQCGLRRDLGVRWCFSVGWSGVRRGFRGSTGFQCGFIGGSMWVQGFNMDLEARVCDGRLQGFRALVYVLVSNFNFG